MDIHSHILPGIDDGAKSLADSLELCRIAADDGVKTIVCTPHIDFRYVNNRATIEGPFRSLQCEVAAEGMGIDLVKGAEVHMAPDILTKVREKDLVTYNDAGRYLLLEFPFQPVIAGAEDLVYRLRLAGVTPIIAHPERIGYFMDDADRLHQLVRLGALGQVTGGSLMGQFGEKCRKAALAMVERHLVHIVASDCHDASYRRPVLAEVAEDMTRRFGPERARAMFLDYPQAVVAGTDIEPPAPEETRGGLKGFLARLLSRDT